MPRRYYLLETHEKKAELYIFGDIVRYKWRDEDINAYGIAKELETLEVDTVNVHINSCGGEVSEGLAIYNMLKNKGVKVVTYCDGFACSAASVVFMAGDERIMNEASLLMVHHPWTWMRGNAKDFRKKADDMDKIAQATIKAYMSKVSIDEKKLKELLDEESWISAEEAKEFGFATKILERDDDGVQQSAISMIRDRVLKKFEPENFSDVSEKIENKIVEKVIQGITPILHKATEEKAQPSKSGWSAFFNKEKENKGYES